jgi:hypothetical protein
MTHTPRLLAVLVIVATVLGASACAGKSIRQISSDPSRYRNQEVKVTGDVIDSYSVGSRGLYHVDDGTGRLWVASDRGVPRKGARVTVWGTIREGFNLGALGDLVKLPGNAIILVERYHRTR